MNEFNSQEIVQNIIQVVSEACTASQTIHNSSQLHEEDLKEGSSASLSTSNLHQTLIVQEEEEP